MTAAALERNRYPLVDIDLARKLERTEGNANAAFVESRARQSPEVGAVWREIGGAFAMFDGAESPLTQTFGLGLFGTVEGADLDEMEEFFTSRGAPVHHEICPLAEPSLLRLLHERSYTPLEFSSVLFRPTGLEVVAEIDSFRVRRIGLDEVEHWSRISAEGWASESAELAGFVEAFGLINVRSRDAHCFLAELDGSAVAAASLSLSGGVALLAGASTIPSGRRQGAQLALLRARLSFAAENGAQLAMMVAQPGSASQRNAERQGFRIAYTRLKWQLVKQPE